MAPTPSIDNDTATVLQETVCELTTTTTSVQQYRRKAWSLCSEYLGGDWSTVLLDEFRLKTVKGGLSSLLFLAELPNSKRTKDTIHHQVLVRLRLDEDPEYTHHESLIFNILSERKMGPKLLGSFKDGRLEEFIPSRCLYCNEISLPRVARQVASLMVQVHCLQMPVSKKPNHMRITRSWLKKLEDKIGQADLALYHTQATVDPKDYPKIISVDTLLTELEFLEEFMKQSGSPVVFCHNDFSPANTLLKDGGDVNGNIDSEANSLMLIDFEFSDYNYRGFDLGQFFCCPGLDFSLTPYTFDLDKMECPDLRDTFCNAYLDEAYKAKTRLGNDFPTNLVTGNRDMDMAQLKIEADCYTALSCFFFGSWALSQAYIRKDEGTFNYHQYGRDRICAYYRQKRHILEFLGRL